MQPNCPVARSRNLVTLEVQELVAWHILRQDVTAVSLQHRREHDAVEYDVILTDEVNELGILALPILLPVRCKILGSRDIADWSIEPNIENLALSSLNRHRDSPIQIAAYGTWQQTSVEPALALTINVRFPLLVALENPLAEHLLVLIERQVPVLCFALYRSCTRESRIWVDKLLRREGRATYLALIAVCTLSVTLRASTLDVAVCEERLRLLIVELLGGLLHELALVVELAEECRSGLCVGL